jgi:hypothetical protein
MWPRASPVGSHRNASKPMTTISDFTDSELWIIETTLRERYGRPVDVQLADSELRLDPQSTQLSACPTAYWREGDCHFVVFKTGDRRYRAQFFYRVHQQFGTGVPEFSDLSECLVLLLQVQADHASERDGEFPGGEQG